MTTNQPNCSAVQASSADVVTQVAKAYIDSLHRSGLTHNNWANLPNAQRSEIRHGMQSVVEFLAATGRLLADDETRFTAEQVEDVQRILSVIPTHRTDANANLVQAIASAHRLRARFAATEPAEARCASSFDDHRCELRDDHDGDFHKADNSHIAWEVDPAPAEPAEEETETETEWAIEFPGGICNISFDPADPEEMLQWIRDGKLVRRDVTTSPWIDAGPSSVEPAEEGTKAEEKLVAHRDSKGDIYVGHALVAFKHRSYEQIRRWFNEAHPGGISERRYRAVLHLLNVEASSPVVPAPTEASVIGGAAVALRAALAVVDPHETGPWDHAWLSVRDLEDCASRAEVLAESEWQTWQEVPRGQTVRAANGERFRKNSVGAIHLLTNGDGDCCQMDRSIAETLPAPFVATEEQDR